MIFLIIQLIITITNKSDNDRQMSDLYDGVKLFMIKLQDFAAQQGVTDRQMQRLLKKYAEELEGLYERRGSNGTWFSEEACELLRSKMKKAPVGVPDSKVKELEAKIEELRKSLDEKEKLIAVAQQQAQNALNHSLELQKIADKVPLLEADTKVLEAENERLKRATLGERIFGWKKYKE